MGSAKDLWLSPNPSKRWCEVLFLAYSPFWIIWALCVVVPFQLYEGWKGWGYFACGACACTPCFLLPMFIEGKADAGKPWHQKFWVKANIWIAVFSFIGNYFWTHYFYKLLGAQYLVDAWELNEVPIVMYLMTHAYFCFYHALSNVLLRRVSNASKHLGKVPHLLACAALVFVLSYSTAYGETLTISHYPYYAFKDRDQMYSIGSLFYAIYFFVSFPMFYRIEEQAGSRKFSLWQCVLDACAAGMLVTIGLDLWRITFGSLAGVGGEQGGLPWVS